MRSNLFEEFGNHISDILGSGGAFAQAHFKEKIRKHNELFVGIQSPDINVRKECWFELFIWFFLMSHKEIIVKRNSVWKDKKRDGNIFECEDLAQQSITKIVAVYAQGKLFSKEAFLDYCSNTFNSVLNDRVGYWSTRKREEEQRASSIDQSNSDDDSDTMESIADTIEDADSAADIYRPIEMDQLGYYIRKFIADSSCSFLSQDCVSYYRELVALPTSGNVQVIKSKITYQIIADVLGIDENKIYREIRDDEATLKSDLNVSRLWNQWIHDEW